MFKSRSQSKKAVEARRWRISAKEKRRFNTLVTEYVQFKHHDIYNECYQLYNTLNEKHPDAGNLTKTRTFKRMIEDHKDESVPNETTSSSVGEDFVDESNPNETALSSVEGDFVDESNPNGTALSSVEEDFVDESNPNEPNPNETTLSTVEDFVDESNPNETTLSSVGDIVDEPVRNESDNILSLAIQETLAAHDYANINEIENVDDFINEIINDLEENDAVRGMLADDDDEYVQPQYQYEDEGIGLNLEDELMFDIEPFDYQLEVEDFEF